MQSTVLVMCDRNDRPVSIVAQQPLGPAGYRPSVAVAIGWGQSS